MKHQDAAADDGDKEEEEEEEEERTVSGAADSSRGGIRQLPDFGQSPVNSFAGSSTVGQHAGTHFSGLFSSGHCNPTVICLRCTVNSGLQGATFFFLEPQCGYRPARLLSGFFFLILCSAGCHFHHSKFNAFILPTIWYLSHRNAVPWYENACVQCCLIQKLLRNLCPSSSLV